MQMQEAMHGQIDQQATVCICVGVTMEWASLEQRCVDTPDHDLGTVGVIRDGPRFVVVRHHQPLHILDGILNEWGENQQIINAIIIMLHRKIYMWTDI